MLSENQETNGVKNQREPVFLFSILYPFTRLVEIAQNHRQGTASCPPAFALTIHLKLIWVLPKGFASHKSFGSVCSLNISLRNYISVHSFEFISIFSYFAPFYVFFFFKDSNLNVMQNIFAESASFLYYWLWKVFFLACAYPPFAKPNWVSKNDGNSNFKLSCKYFASVHCLSISLFFFSKEKKNN